MYQKTKIQNNTILENLDVFLDSNIWFECLNNVNLLGENNG